MMFLVFYSVYNVCFVRNSAQKPNLFQRIKHELEVELADAYDNFKIAQQENEKLIETNRVQSELWKAWLEKEKHNNLKPSKEPLKENPNEEDEIQVVLISTS